MLEIERKIPYDFTYMWNLKNRINRQQTGGCQRRKGS